LGSLDLGSVVTLCLGLECWNLLCIYHHNSGSKKTSVMGERLSPVPCDELMHYLSNTLLTTGAAGLPAQVQRCGSLHVKELETQV